MLKHQYGHLLCMVCHRKAVFIKTLFLPDGFVSRRPHSGWSERAQILCSSTDTFYTAEFTAAASFMNVE